MNSRWSLACVTMVVLIATGITGRWLAAPILSQQNVRRGEPLVLPSSKMGQGISLAFLGGFQRLAANVLWLRANRSWERRDRPGLETNLRLAIAVDPRALPFWINGARMLAYDVPAWNVSADAEAVARSRREQALVALAWLDEAERFHPREPALSVERANIHLHALHDVLGAAENYRRAAEMPDAPSYAATVHVQLLRRVGRDAEAYAWLVRHHAILTERNETAAARDVLKRIQEFETALAIPPERRYRPSSD